MDRLWNTIAKISARYPFVVLGLTLVASVPAGLAIRNLGLDTNLKRLLPEHAPSVRWAHELEGSVGDGGYFAILVEGTDRQQLIEVIEEIGEKASALPTVESADYRNPIEFIDKYRYTLVPNSVLTDFRDEVEKWEIEVNPFLLDLGETDADISRSEVDKNDGGLDRNLNYYVHMDEYHSDPEGRIFGMIIRTKEGISNLSSLRRLYGELQSITAATVEGSGLWWAIGGNLRTRVDEFDLIVSDLGRAGFVSVMAIVLTLALSFRSVRVLPVILYPLAMGLLWSFSLVPTLVGDLNSITAFALLVLFGMGVDYAIHLTSRFQAELIGKPVDVAIEETLHSTGRSVLTSGATTTVALFILATSDFRGFSDFGVIGGTSIGIVTLSMVIVWPACAVAGARLNLVQPRKPATEGWGIPLPVVAVTFGILVLVGLSVVATFRYLEFDYDFTNLSAKIPGKEEIDRKQRKVYPATSAPAALYVAKDIEALDKMLLQLEKKRSDTSAAATIGTVNSIRNFAPKDDEFGQRLDTIAEMQDTLSGRWVRKLEDPDRKEIVDDFLAFDSPGSPPRLGEVPYTISRELMARDGSGELLITVDTEGGSRDGRVAMAFTKDLYDIDVPDGVRGPTGDKPVMAEILWLVTGESGRMIALTFGAIFLLVLLDRRSLIQTVWVLVPLAAGLVLTVGVMVALGWKLNFFNMVVLPTMLGVGVDHGVHYVRRWKELDRDTRTTHDELFGPITVASVTTVMGYLGMVFAHHPGLRSIGLLALIGLAATWFTALILLPGLLRLLENRSAIAT